MHRLRILALIASILLAPLVCAAADEVLFEAKRYLDQGNPQAAYEILVPLQADRAGDPDYDFLLGSAALQLGKNTEAVFALERVLAVRPDATPARTLIARAYFNLKETEAAKREFENVRNEQVPEEVAQTIDRFLDAIRRIEESQRVTIGGYVEVGGGYDSNVNSATAESQVAVPAFGGAIVSLSDSSQQQRDGFISFGGGVGMRAPISKTWSAFGGVAYANKTNFNEDDFSTYSWDLNTGISHKRDRNTITLAVQLNAFFVNDPQSYRHAYREAVGGTLQWQHDFNARNQVNAYLQATQLTYPDQRVRNADRYVGGVGYARAVGQNDLIAYVGAYGGQEREKDRSSPEFGHDLFGIRFGAQQFLSEKYSIFANASVEKRQYGGPDASFMIDREDDQYSIAGGIHLVPGKDRRVTLQASWTDNRSNIAIYEFDRWLVSAGFRHEF